MNDFEDELRSHLKAASKQAPPSDRLVNGLGPGSTGAKAANRSPLRVGLAAAAVVAVTVTGLSLWFQADKSEGPNDGSDAACPTLLQLDGRSYDGVGGVVRTPRPGSVVGEAVLPGCDDGNGRAGSEPIQAHAIPGIAPEVAVLAGGRIWEAQDAPVSTAEELGEFLKPVRCTGPQERTLQGEVLGVGAKPVAEDYHATAPYVATFRAHAGPGLPLERHASVQIRIRVTTETIGGEDPDLLRQALGEGDEVTATVRCDGQRFRAVALSLS